MNYYRKKDDLIDHLKKQDEHKKIMDYNLDFLKFRDCFKDYLYLKKVFAKGNLKKKLKEFTEESKEKSLNPSTDKQGRPTFFASARYLADTYGSRPGNWNKAINIFFFLGLIEKITYKDQKSSTARIRTRKYRVKLEEELNKEIRPTTHYHVYKLDQETLTKANEQAKKLVENDFTIELFGEEWLKRIFGKETANRIYPLKQKPKKKQIDDKIINDYFNKRLEEIIKEQGYIKPRDLKDLVQKELLSYTNAPRKRKAMVKRINVIYNLELEEMLEEKGYKIINSNKELNKKYNLSGNGYPKIIVKRD